MCCMRSWPLTTAHLLQRVELLLADESRAAAGTSPNDMPQMPHIEVALTHTQQCSSALGARDIRRPPMRFIRGTAAS